MLNRDVRKDIVLIPLLKTFIEEGIFSFHCTTFLKCSLKMSVGKFVAFSFFGSDIHDLNHQEDIQKNVFNYLWFEGSIIKKRFQSYFYYDCLFFSRGYATYIRSTTAMCRS